MIRREDLLEAIAECEGVRHPTSSTCLRLASYYTILNQMEGGEGNSPPPSPRYSFAPSPEVKMSETEFGQLVTEKGISKVMPIVDEAMQCLLVTNPRLHDSIIRQIRSL